MEDNPVKIMHGWRYHAKGAIKDLFDFALAVAWFLIIAFNLSDDQQTKLSEQLNAPFGFVMCLVWVSLILLCSVLAFITKWIVVTAFKLIKLLWKLKTKH